MPPTLNQVSTGSNPVRAAIHLHDEGYAWLLNVSSILTISTSGVE